MSALLARTIGRTATITRRTLLMAAGSSFLAATPRKLAAQPPVAIKFGRAPVNAIISNYLGPVDFFRDEGVAIEPFRVDNPGQLFQAMASGEVPVAEVGVAPALIALVRGLPFIAPFLGSCSTPERPYERIMVLPNAPIHTLDDLKGKKMAFQGPGTVPDMLLGALPRRSKIRKEDIQLVPMPPPNQPDALGQGLVDAIFAIPPADTVAERKYSARTVADATELVPYSGLSTLIMRRDFAEAHSDAAGKILTAAIRFERWIDDNPAPARAAMGKNLALPDDLTATARLPVFARNGLPVMPNIWHVYQMLLEAKTVDPHPDPMKLFEERIVAPTRQFTLPAVERLGIESDPALEKNARSRIPAVAETAGSLLRRVGAPHTKALSDHRRKALCHKRSLATSA